MDTNKEEKNWVNADAAWQLPPPVQKQPHPRPIIVVYMLSTRTICDSDYSHSGTWLRDKAANHIFGQCWCQNRS